MSSKESLRGLYVISDDRLTPKESLLQSIEKALQGGARIVQLRDKISSDDELRAIIPNLTLLCKEYNALFVLNDKVELAIELGVEGLHIGKSDHHRFKAIRKDFKGIIGVSCYGDLVLAKEMQEMGANYVAFGSFFHSPTKPHSNIVDLKILSKAKEALRIPICAIGGINGENASELISHYQPDMVAVISDIWTNDITHQAQFYSKLYQGE
ncbi:MAG: thiamine phosphate synthase [Campylobacterales bacterium]|nr:thiamine phosphate synthase [Campylobacterales bacterium]